MNIPINKEVKNLVKARLSVLPKDVMISIGADGSFNRDELIDHVEKGDKIGRKMIKMNMEFLQALKEGVLYGLYDSDN